VPHLDVFVYKSLCRTCTFLSTAACASPVDVSVLLQPVLCQKVYTGECAAHGCTSICSTVVWIVLGGVWPTAAIAKLIDVSVYKSLCCTCTIYYIVTVATLTLNQITSEWVSLTV
jgi:hypothetical protein